MAREIETKCIHLEEEENSINHYGAISYPIYQSAFSSGCRSLDRSDRLDDLWTAGIYAASIGDRFRSFNLLE